jgi:predicted permease
MITLWKDVRFALRGMRKNPGFTAVVALSLGLGIGANSAIFTLVNAVFLQPIPVEDPASLLNVYTSDPKNPGFLPVSYANYLDYRDRNNVFSGMAGYQTFGVALRTESEPKQIPCEMATGNYFSVLGVKPFLGRTFGPEEDGAPGAHPVVVLSHAFWTTQYGANPGILGQTLILNGYPYTVIGVAPPNFRGATTLGGPLIWAPMATYRQLMPQADLFMERRFLWVNMLGRLRTGVGQRQAQAALQTLATQLQREYPKENEGRNVLTVSLAESAIDPNGRGNLIRIGEVLMTIVGLVLLIACANIANLLMVRSSARRKEIAIRLSMGASQWRLLQQLLTESTLLAAIGGVAGLLIAYWGRDLLWSLRPPFLGPNAINLALDGRVLLFTLAITVFTGLLFGLAPALQSARPDLVLELKERASHSSHGGGYFHPRNLLVVSQVALSLIALVGAGLFVRSMRNAQQTNPGFDAAHLGSIAVNPGGQGYTPERAQEYYRQAMARLQATPGIASASVTDTLPLGPGGFSRSIFLEGQTQTPGNRGVLVLANNITPGYFETMRIPVLKGRAFTEADRAGSRQVAIINSTMAKKFWPGQDAVGRRFSFFGDTVLTEVVGVVKDNKYFAISENPLACVYQPLWQSYSPAASVVFRSSGDPNKIIGTARQQVQSLDRNLLLTNVSTMGDLIDQSLWAPRMGAGLLAVFGFLALGLSAIGMYGVMAFSVAQRTSELGIRMALGARPGDVFRMVLKQGFALALCGVIIGLAAAVALARLVANLLIGVGTGDFATFAGTAVLLVAVALLASYAPARRATSIDPVEALRAE